ARQVDGSHHHVRRRRSGHGADSGAALNAQEPAGDEVRWLDRDQQHAWRAFMVGTTLLLDRLDAELRAEFTFGLNEYEVLVRLSESDNHRMRMSSLADALSFSRSRVTHTVKRMESMELVTRTRSGGDGRGITCELTPKGREK